MDQIRKAPKLTVIQGKGGQANRNINTKKTRPALKARMAGRKKFDDLSFVYATREFRRWWDVVPPKTEDWHDCRMLGREYAFELLDVIHNPDAEIPEHFLCFIANSMTMWRMGPPYRTKEAIAQGFFEVLSEYLTTGRGTRRA